jgi:hypothetical protein
MHAKKQAYQIRIKGHVNIDWSVWFEDLSVEHTDSGETLLCGLLPDQTALHGILMKIRDLGLTLVEVKYIQPDSSS